MKMKPYKGPFRLNKTSHSVRASQAVLQYGVGAMVDFPSQTLMMAAPEYWENNTVPIHDDRLEKVLNVDSFRMPAGPDGAKYNDGIAYVRFPEWYFCPKCRRFMPVMDWVSEYNKSGFKRDSNEDMTSKLMCPKDSSQLVPARIVTACSHGHIDDFPWIKWVHCKNMVGGPKPVCQHPALKIYTSSTSSEGLEGLTLECTACHAKATLKDAFNKNIFEELDEKHEHKYDFTCTGRHPWKNVREDCLLYPKVLQRGSSSVYFPVTVSSLVIPPYSSELNRRINESEKYTLYLNACSEIRKYIKDKDQLENALKDIMNEYAEQIAMEIHVMDSNQVLTILKRKGELFRSDDSDTSGVSYKSEEYDALSGKINISSMGHDDFIREPMNIKEYDMPFIKDIVLIHHVREVQALIGFSRIDPVDSSAMRNGSLNFVSVKDSETRWYPGYNVYGEGIFIEFDEEAIDKWRNGNKWLMERVELINKNYANSFFGSQRPRKITSKFLLLHTVSHLLIKQLSFECGYNVASLKERIYCSEASDGYVMSGILIYTASGDSEGTLGGLVRQGRPDTFPRVYKRAIESAVSCSNDPVCSLSSGQGRDSLNLAACYSCALLPETCCEEFNVFLDRAVMVGTVKERNMGFFSRQIFGDAGWKGVVNDRMCHENVTDEKKAEKTFIFNRGIDLAEEDPRDIIKDVLNWTDSLSEKEFLERILSDNSFGFDEKPFRDSEFSIIPDNQELTCTLYWKEKGIMYFTEERKADYKKAIGSGYTCIYGPEADAETFRKLLAEN